MLKFKTDLFKFNTFKWVRIKSGWISLFFLTVGLFCFSLSYIHSHPLVKKSSPTRFIQRVSYGPPLNLVNRVQPSESIPSATDQGSFPEILPTKSTSAEETAPLAIPGLADGEEMIEEPTGDVFFGYLELVGVTVSDYDPLKSKAIIGDLLISRQKSYSLGSVIPYGARIIRIDEKGIMLEKERVKKRLLLSEKLGNPADIAVLRSKGYKRIADREWLITPNRLIKDTTHIYKLLSEASIRPHFDSGKVEGFRVNKIKPAGVINELGLKVGDVISTVNGRAIDSIAGAYEAYQQTRNEPIIRLGLSRQRQEVSLVYHIIADGPPKYDVKAVLWSPSITKLFVNE